MPCDHGVKPPHIVVQIRHWDFFSTAPAAPDWGAGYRTDYGSDTHLQILLIHAK
jgi:hypothetical protein